MKVKTIKSVLRRKLDAWLASIEDEAVRKLAAEGTTVTAPIIPVTNEELNACAVMVARADYRKEYDWKTKQWIPDVHTQDDADQSLIVDSGLRPNFIVIAKSYDWLGVPTKYHKYLEDGRKLCIKMKLAGEKIVMPVLRVCDGYHVTRSAGTGSAALVKDGEPEPVFRCAEGYHESPNGCVKD